MGHGTGPPLTGFRISRGRRGEIGCVATPGRMFDSLGSNLCATYPLTIRGGKGGTRGADRNFGAARFNPEDVLELHREDRVGARRKSSDALPGIHRVRRDRRDCGLSSQLLRPSGEPVPGALGGGSNGAWPLVLLGANLHLSPANL
jgi:hypothetical protein